MPPGLLIAAPASGSGKTLVTLALLRAFRNAGRRVGSVKVGPDYIDPAFHAAASGRPCLNLDAWAMRPDNLARLAHSAAADAELVIGEGVMGLFDGAHTGTGNGSGSTAEISERTGWPVVLVVDAHGMAASAAALVQGFAGYRETTTIAGVIFNRIGGPGHAAILREACTPLGIPVLGALPRKAGLALPDRHLGLVQALEHPNLEAFLERAAELAARHLDLDRLAELAQPLWLSDRSASPFLPPLGQRIAVGRDAAFAFAYPFVLDAWRAAGAELSFFSPLADDAPAADSDAVYLPGGYPELHPGRLAGNAGFLDGLRAAAGRGAAVYGECGGYMVLGRGLTDADGTRHAMAGLLPVETSFAEPKLHLGYREVVLREDSPLGRKGQGYRGHEFHYASLEPGLPPGTSPGQPLFACRDARGQDRGPAGCRVDSVFGSFLHLIDRTA